MSKNNNWKVQLRLANLKATSKRLLVLDTLEKFPHSTSEQIHSLCNERCSCTVQGIYLTLGDLTYAGLVRRIDMPNAASLYEVNTGDNHHHLHCILCNKILDVPCPVGQPPCIIPVDNKGFYIETAEVTYRGKCSDCTEHSK